MQAVILTAGASTRFYPLADEVPKCMVPLLGKPILAHTILSLTKMGIIDIILVTGKDSPIKASFGNGGKYGAKISFITQEKPLGMGNALLCASKLIKEDFFLLHGHHLDIGEFILQMVGKKRDADGVLLGEVRENPWEYGVIKIDGDCVLRLIEKPKKESDLGKVCVVGIYLLTPQFLPFLEKVKLEHYQLETALDKFAEQRKLKVLITEKKTVTLKYPWDLLRFKNYLLEQSSHRISRGAKIGKGVILVGKMIIEEGATIYENATVKGPVYIGKNVLIGNNALVRDESCLEENCRVGAFSEVKNSIFLPGSTLGSGFIASSIIGENCRLAHGFISANRRFDRKTIKVKVKDGEIETGLDDLGVMMGEGVSVGVGVGTMPGVTIGKGATIGPGTFVFEDVPPGVKYFAQLKNIIKK